MRAFNLLLLAAIVSSCATSQKLNAGSYDETPESGILWVGHTITLHADQTFSYNRWSDDMGNDEYGTGTYQVKRKVLRLAFEKQPPPRSSQVQAYSINYKPDTLVYDFQVNINSLGRSGIEPLPYATLVALSSDNKVVSGNATNENGRATLRIARATRPQLLQVSFIGYLTLKYPCPASSTAYQVLLESNRGTPVPAGTNRKYSILHVADSQFVMLLGKHKTLFKLQP
jgi:hypothetical protein